MNDLDHIINQARAREDATSALLDQIPVPGGWKLDMACEGRRPRTGLELGLRPEMFEGRPEGHHG